MNKILCSLACTWMTIIDSQFYIIDSLSEMFHWNEMLSWWLPGCNLKYNMPYQWPIFINFLCVIIVANS